MVLPALAQAAAGDEAIAREGAGEPASAALAFERAVALSPGYKEASEGLARAKKAGA